MLSRETLLAHAARLLETLPGVAVISNRLTKRQATLAVVVSSNASLQALERIALGANVSIEPWPKSNEPQPSVRNITAKIRRRDVIERGELQLLAIHLAWHLHNTGVLTSDQVNPLLREWHAVEVGTAD